MAEHDSERKTERRGPDLLTLLAGIATLGVSTFVLTDGRVRLPAIDPNWVVAGIALVVGLFFLIGSLRRGR